MVPRPGRIVAPNGLSVPRHEVDDWSTENLLLLFEMLGVTPPISKGIRQQ
jgi:hypothetical protein